MTDIALLRRRHRPTDGNRGRECWLIGVYPPGESTPILAVTNHAGDVIYDGVRYIAYHCSILPPDTDSDYALPEAKLRISNILRALIPSLAANDYYRNYLIKAIPYNDAEPGANYATDIKQLTWVNHEMDGQDVISTLSVPGELTRPVPPDVTQAGHCRHRFRLAAGVYADRCGYTAKTIEDVIIPGGPAYGRLAIQVTGHGWLTGDLIEISGTGGLTPDLDNVYTIEKFNDDVVKLDGTDGEDYSGAWDSNGVAGFFACEQHRAACIRRGRLPSFSALLGQGDDTLKVAV